MRRKKKYQIKRERERKKGKLIFHYYHFFSFFGSYRIRSEKVVNSDKGDPWEQGIGVVGSRAELFAQTEFLEEKAKQKTKKKIRSWQLRKRQMIIKMTIVIRTLTHVPSASPWPEGTQTRAFVSETGIEF